MRRSKPEAKVFVKPVLSASNCSIMVAPPSRVFLIAPAPLEDKRVQALNAGKSDVVRRLRSRDGAPIGEVFAVIGGPYVRRKLTYAQTFARPPVGHGWLERGVLVITRNGLVPSTRRMTEDHLDSLTTAGLHPGDPGRAGALLRDAERLAEALGEGGEAVLLGSLAGTDYVVALCRALPNQLRIPTALIDKGDLSRSSILLRCVRENCELTYAKP